MHLFRVVVAWAGPQVVGSAVNVLHFDGSNQSAPPVAAIKGAYGFVANVMPTGSSVTIPTTGDVIEDTTGELVGVWTGAGGGAVNGMADAKAAAGVGGCVGWQTGGIVNGRKLRGRTFLVPLSISAYDGDGTFTASAANYLKQFADGLQAAGPLAVLHRPTSKGASDGTSYGVIANRVRDKVAYLSSRRD